MMKEGDPVSDSETDATEEDALDAAAKVRKKVMIDKKITFKQTESLHNLAAKRESHNFSFEHVTVHVPEAKSMFGRCIDCSPFRFFLQDYLGVAVEEQSSFYALDNISGYMEAGEMILIVTPNALSASTLLRTLTGRLYSNQADVTGSIYFNGIPLSKNDTQPWRRVMPYVSAQDTTHSAVLTVRETIEFAAQCTRAKIDVTNVVTNLLRGLDLEHVADTVVGDENLRGVSGGQKRRVTVGEMLTDEKVNLLGLENITDGLSSNDSYNLIHRIQAVCQIQNIAAIMSLSQPSDEIVALFDKILVLTHHGEQVYFGAPDREVLRGIFLDSNNEVDDIADKDNGSICDLVLGGNALNDPKKEDELVKRFMNSSDYSAILEEIGNIRKQAPPARDRNAVRNNLQNIANTKQKYASNSFHQFHILARRRLKLIMRNTVTWTRIGIAIFFGIIVGSLFGSLENDLIGSLSRTGFMFLNCFLVLMLSAAIAIPQTFRDRLTLFKHRQAEFYSGYISYITNVLLDLPLAFLEAVLLSVITYFWVDQKPGAGHFFYFMFVLVGLEFVGQAFGRFLCAISRTQVCANTLSSVFLLIFGTVAGFMPNYDGIPWVFRWLSWLTPAAYAFEGLMMNEFTNREIKGVVVNHGGENVELGTISGEFWLSNFSIPRVEWGDTSSILALDICMLFILSVVFDLLGSYFVEHTRDWYFNTVRRSEPKTKSFGFLRDKRKSKEMEEEQQLVEEDINPHTLSVRDLNYFVPLKNKGGKGGENELQLLRGIECRFGRGRMCALMGTSGAGKTTLLDVLAGYKNIGRITGEKTDVSSMGYAEQVDILNPYLSVQETLRFTAACCSKSQAEVEKITNEVLELMGLAELGNSVVGREDADEGLPKHARKRLTIAVQLVTRPRILFADEPTTGLGTTAANLVTSALRRVTEEMGLITIATIHQPSVHIWESFDDLLLLVKGGKLAYMGAIGKKSQHVFDHFSSLSGIVPSPRVNPADFTLSAVDSVPPDKAAEAYQGSRMKKDLIEKINGDFSSIQSLPEANKLPTRNKNPIKQFLLLTKRHLITQWRNPNYSFMRFFTSVVVSTYIGILFIGEKNELSGAVLSIGAIFFLVFLLVIPMQAAVVPLIEDRAVLYREATSGLYSRWAYGFGQLAADIPFHVINGVFMWVCFYFLVDFRQEEEQMRYFVLMIILANWVIMSIGQLYALVTPNEESANGLAGLSVILSVILMGFLIMYHAMADGWKWAYWANLFHYIVQGLVTNELAGKEYTLYLLDPGKNNSSRTENSRQLSFANITDPREGAFIFRTGTDLSTGSLALQSAGFLNLALQAGPGGREPSEAGSRVLAAFIQCLVENDCLVDPIATNFMSCTILPGLPSGRSLKFEPPVCKDTWDNLTESVNLAEIEECFASGRQSEDDDDNTIIGSNITSSEQSRPTTHAGLWGRGVPSDVTLEDVDAMGHADRLRTVLCLVNVFMPGTTQLIIETITNILNEVFGIVLYFFEIIEDVLTNGIPIPGELILFTFGWAEVEGTNLEAPYKWYYCLTSVVVFLAGIEIMKLFALRFIVWTKR